MFVVTADQISSRSAPDLVPATLEVLRELNASFERTVGDEIQGVSEDPGEVRAIVLLLLRAGWWHVGIGAGEGRYGSTVRDGSGPAFLHARAAVESAKKVTRFEPSIAVRADDEQVAADCQGLLRLLGHVVQSRSDAQWEAIDALREGMTPAEIAADLGISVEAVSQRRGYGGMALEDGVLPLLDGLFRKLS